MNKENDNQSEQLNVQQAQELIIKNYVTPMRKMFGDKWFDINTMMIKLKLTNRESAEELIRALVQSGYAAIKQGGKNYKHQIIFKITPTLECTLAEIDNEIDYLKRQLSFKESERGRIVTMIEDVKKIVGDQDSKKAEI